MNANFWRGKRVLLTGHTGFKGSWLACWLQQLGAILAGYALPASPSKSLFELAAVEDSMDSVYGDIREPERLWSLLSAFKPEIVFHLAAQPLVLESYLAPVETYQVNVMGTVHLLEAIRSCSSCRVVVNVTSDKCYRNEELACCYRESDPLGGYDPYSSSKGCAELITAAYRRSYFSVAESRHVAVATVRAGNVLGGGDFSKDRLIPDFIAAAREGKRLHIRNPDAVRPWQHVLEPLSGYLLLAEKLWYKPSEYTGAWNFGPALDDVRPVRWVVEKLNECWGEPVCWEIDEAPKPHEARLLALDSTKARMLLGWQPQWTLERALQEAVYWYKAYGAGVPLRDVVIRQICSYEGMTNVQ